MGGGIPPSLDRQERLVRTALGFGALLLVAAGLLALGLRLARGGAPAEVSATPASRLDAYRLENERASAYQVVRDTLDARARTGEVAGVFCRDSRHTISGRYWEFRGQVDLEYPGKRLERHPYIVTLTGSAGEGWAVVSCEVLPGEG